MDPNIGIENQLVALLYALTAIGGIIGNVMTLTAFLKAKSRLYFHIQLAAVNILYFSVVSLSGPSALYGRWMFGDTWCQLYCVVGYTAGFGNFSLVLAICIESYAAICCKQWYERRSGNTYAAGSVGLWAYSLIFGLAPFFGWNSYVEEGFGGSCCDLDFHQMNFNHLSYLWAILGGSVAMMTTAVVCLMLAFQKTKPEEKPLSPLLIDWALVKATRGILVMTILGGVLYAYRIVKVISFQSDDFGFVSKEMSHITLKLAASLCPLCYYTFGVKFEAPAQSVVTENGFKKKRK